MRRRFVKNCSKQIITLGTLYNQLQELEANHASKTDIHAKQLQVDAAEIALADCLKVPLPRPLPVSAARVP
jgi:hypothetical protein